MKKTIKAAWLSNNKKSQKSEKLEAPKLFMPYEKGISEQLKRIAYRHGSEVIFTRNCSSYPKYTEETGKILEERMKTSRVI